MGLEIKGSISVANQSNRIVSSSPDNKKQDYGPYFAPKKLADRARIICHCPMVNVVKILKNGKKKRIKERKCTCGKISPSEAILVSLINILQKEKGCFASNFYFAEYLGVTVRRIQQMLQNLKDKGYIQSMEGHSRMLGVGENCPDLVDE